MIIIIIIMIIIIIIIIIIMTIIIIIIIIIIITTTLETRYRDFSKLQHSHVHCTSGKYTSYSKNIVHILSPIELEIILNCAV